MKDLLKSALARSPLGTMLGMAPFARSLYAKSVWSKRMNLYFGIHDRFDDAERFAARFHQVGWNDEALAKQLVGEDSQEAPELYQTSQFAVMLWLAKLLRDGDGVLDIGGAGGTFYELCKRYDILPPAAKWHVVDVPEMIKRGIARHEQLGSSNITFGTETSQAPASAVLLMLGVIQYLPDPLGEKGPGVLEGLTALPAHIIINKLPLTDAPDAWTVQNHVTSAVPYRLFNRSTLMRYFESRGYRLRDRWLVHEISIDIPFHPARSLPWLEGVYFERTR